VPVRCRCCPTAVPRSTTALATAARGGPPPRPWDDWAAVRERPLPGDGELLGSAVLLEVLPCEHPRRPAGACCAHDGGAGTVHGARPARPGRRGRRGRRVRASTASATGHRSRRRQPACWPRHRRRQVDGSPARREPRHLEASGRRQRLTCRRPRPSRGRRRQRRWVLTGAGGGPPSVRLAPRAGPRVARPRAILRECRDLRRPSPRTSSTGRPRPSSRRSWTSTA